MKIIVKNIEVRGKKNSIEMERGVQKKKRLDHKLREEEEERGECLKKKR